MSALESCDYTCLGCGRVVCLESETGAGAADLICSDCYETEDPEDAA